MQADTTRKNLVIVRAGDASLHEGWLPPPDAPRSFDLAVSYFGRNPDAYRRDDVPRLDGVGPKWRGLYELLASGVINWWDFDYICLPDDDLAASPEVFETLFAQMRAHDLALAQPALTPDSHISHAITLHNPRFQLRRTNFVEAMAPVFSCELLARVLPTFVANDSGWGIDWLWQQYLDRPQRDSAIIDAAQVCHTRPVGGPNYERLVAEGRSPHDEMRALLARYGLLGMPQLCWSALTPDGQELRLAGDEAEALTLLEQVMSVTRSRARNEAEVRWFIWSHVQASPALMALQA